MKGKNSTYRPDVGERCLISGPNMDDEDGYVFYETEILWKNETFVLHGNPGRWPNLNMWQQIIAKPERRKKSAHGKENGHGVGNIIWERE